MNASESRTFYYHADANPLGGFVTKPFSSVVPTQASTSLAQAGGHAHDSSGAYSLGSVISVSCTSSETYGTTQEQEGAWVSEVTSVVEGANVLDVVRVEKMVAHLRVRHPHAGYHPFIEFAGCEYSGVTVGGKKVEPTMNLDQFARPRTESNQVLEGPWLDDSQLMTSASEQIRRLVDMPNVPTWVRSRYGWMLDEKLDKGRVVCSLVEGIGGAEPGASFGHLLHVPDLGNLFFGELTVDLFSFGVTMLRVEMGCAAEGTVSFASAHSNGIPMP